MSPVFFIFPVAVILCVAVVLVWLSNRDGGPELEARLRTIAASGPVIVETSTGGRIGWSYNATFGIEVAVYPGGLVLDGFGWGMHAVLASEILDVSWDWHVIYDTLEIKHSGVGCGSPVILIAGRNSSLAAAVRQISGLQSQGEMDPWANSIENVPAPAQKYRKANLVERLVASRMSPSRKAGHDAAPRRRRP